MARIRKGTVELWLGLGGLSLCELDGPRPHAQGLGFNVLQYNERGK